MSTLTQPSPAVDAPPDATFPRRLKGLVVLGLLLVAAFALPLFRLGRFALGSDLYSHILLIPFITAYLIRIHRATLALESRPLPALALLPALGGLAVLAGYSFALRAGWKPKLDDYLAVMTSAFLLFLAGVACLFLGRVTLRRSAFPLLFLIFMVPFPTPVHDWIESFFQFRSADATDLFFGLSGTTYLRNGNEFQLPGFSIMVAPECSGIHSSLVLFITSLLAGWLFLRSPWKRAFLTLAVIPLALLRNGFRIWVIGELCVHVSHEMIHSPIHRHGGPLFFALSLIPFFLLLYFLRRSENPRPGLAPPPPPLA